MHAEEPELDSSESRRLQLDRQENKEHADTVRGAETANLEAQEAK